MKNTSAKEIMSTSGWYLPERSISPILSSKKTVRLAETLESLQFILPEASQVKSYNLDPTEKQNQSYFTLQNMWFIG